MTLDAAEEYVSEHHNIRRDGSESVRIYLTNVVSHFVTTQIHTGLIATYISFVQVRKISRLIATPSRKPNQRKKMLCSPTVGSILSDVLYRESFSFLSFTNWCHKKDFPKLTCNNQQL